MIFNPMEYEAALEYEQQQRSDRWIEIEAEQSLMDDTEIMKGMPAPTDEMLEDSTFEAVWGVIKSWDINVPDAYGGYMGANGNHVRAILNALPKPKSQHSEAVQAFQDTFDE